MRFSSWRRFAQRRGSRSTVDRFGRLAPFVWPQVDIGSAITVASLVCHGVLVDELRMFEHVISDAAGAVSGVNVGASLGPTAGVGGVAVVQETFETHDRRASILFVPGAIGALNAADDAALMRWLDAMIESADWVIATSTGSLLVAATGVLAGRTASTHWLAKDALGRFSTQAADDRITVHGNIITCSGHAMLPTAVAGALSKTPPSKLVASHARVDDAQWQRPAGMVARDRSGLISPI